MLPIGGGMLFQFGFRSRKPVPLETSGTPRGFGRRKVDQMAATVELSTWGRWLLGILITALVSLLALGYGAMDRRINALEVWRTEQASYQADMARQIGEIAARQQMVIQRLNENSTKLDRLLELYIQKR